LKHSGKIRRVRRGPIPDEARLLLQRLNSSCFTQRKSPTTESPAAGDHPRRANERYRKNLEVAAGKKANIREAQDEAITAWLDGRDPLKLQPDDRPTLATVLKT
jgi:hypothetical protein